MTWTDLPSAQARIAEQLRVFLITWDPIERLTARPEEGFATVNVDRSGSELVVYIPIWSLIEAAREQNTAVSVVLAAMAGSAVVTAAARAATATVGSAMASRHGTGRGAERRASDLLSNRAAGAALGTPTIGLVSPTWEDIGLGAITDIAQHVFGPVDLDRSTVVLATVTQRHVRCPACAGRRFGFPADLTESQGAMCPEHRTKAETVIRTRLARANASNPDGWGAIIDASSRIGLPHLPNGLAAKLADAEQSVYIVEATSWFHGRRSAFPRRR